jgi:hypothetical protein
MGMAHIPAIPVLRRMRQEGFEFEASLGLHSKTLPYRQTNKNMELEEWLE